MKDLDPFRFARMLLSFHKKELTENDEKILKEVLDASPDLQTLNEELADKNKISHELTIISSFKTEEALLRVRPEGKIINFPIRYRIAAAAAILIGVCSAYLLIPKPERQTFYSQATDKNGAKVTLRLANGQVLGLDTLAAYQAKEKVVLQNANGVLSVTDDLAQFENGKPVQNRLEVPFKTTYKVVLQDGTRVWLNSGSTLDFPSEFSSRERKVQLSGEAYFEVTHNDKKKFVVETNGMSVQVLGTTFNVKAYKDESVIYTTLMEGSVSVKDKSGRILKIVPGEQAAYDRDQNEMVMRFVDTSLYTSWKEGSFDFENAPLDDILRRVGRWYGLDIVYLRPNLKSTVFSGKMKMYDSVEDVLRKFEKSGDLHFELEKNTISVSKN